MFKRKKKQHDKENGRRLNIVTLCVNVLVGAICFSILVFTLVKDPIILALKQYTRVSNGSFVHEFMMRETAGVLMRATLFNLSNARAFAEGSEPVLRVTEVGPFTYREVRSHADVVIDEARARLGYTPRVRTQFAPELSAGRPEDAQVTVPNIPMLGQASKMADEAYWRQLSFNMVANHVVSRPLVTLDAASYMWGYEEPLVSLSHSLMPASVPAKMGLLDQLYDQRKSPRIEVSIADEDKYTIKSVNGHERLAMGEDQDPDTCSLCNTFENTYEGVGYPPGFDSSFKIKLFRIGLCRTFDLEYQGSKQTAYGAPALLYRFTDRFFTLRPGDTSTGVLPLPECFLAIPLAVSKPHFQDAHPSVYERVEGIHPDPQRFPAYIAVDPKIGLQLETRISLQLNLVVGDVSFNAQAKQFANMVLPICFIEIEQAPLPEESRVVLSNVYERGPWLVLAARAVLLALLLACWGLAARALLTQARAPHASPARASIAEINANTIAGEPLVEESLTQDKSQQNSFIYSFRNYN